MTSFKYSRGFARVGAMILLLDLINILLWSNISNVVDILVIVSYISLNLESRSSKVIYFSLCLFSLSLHILLVLTLARLVAPLLARSSLFFYLSSLSIICLYSLFSIWVGHDIYSPCPCLFFLLDFSWILSVSFCHVCSWFNLPLCLYYIPW